MVAGTRLLSGVYHGDTALTRIPYALCLVALSVVLLACRSTDNGEPRPTPIATSEYEAQLGEAAWQQVQTQAWYDDGRVSPDGLLLLDVVASGGPLWLGENSLTVIETYPDGIDALTWRSAERYARATLRTPHEVILEPWLADGVDTYEQAVLDAVSGRTVSIAALRRALEDGFFRETFEANLEGMGAIEIDALGSLQPRMLERLRDEGWFEDGISQYEASLLGILNNLVAVEEQIAILEDGNHQPVELASRTIAVVYAGDEPELQAEAHAIIEEWMPQVEAFVGEFRPVGLIVDLTQRPEVGACHAGGNAGFRPGHIGLPLPFCFQAGVLIHELAHVFIGGRYPVWFSEGVAEMVAYHFTGARSGYEGGVGRIELEGSYPVFSQAYYDQASAGSDFLEAVYDLAGPDETSSLIRDVGARSLSGHALLERILSMETSDQAGLEALITDAFRDDAGSR